MRGVSEVSPPVIEDVVEKEKKKSRRRSNRRSKQNSPILGSSSCNDMLGELVPQSDGSGVKAKSLVLSTGFTLLRRPDFGSQPLTEHVATAASNLAYDSMPNIHIIEDAEKLAPSDLDGSFFSKSCPYPAGGDSPYELLPPPQSHAQSKIFAPHWRMETVTKALESGDAFKSVFRVNAHNKVEAYCKIEGLPIDILINGFEAQNRAVEGDIVAITVDPLPCWTKMRGSNCQSSNISNVGDCNLLPEANESVGQSLKGKCKVHPDQEVKLAASISSQKCFDDEDVSCNSEAVVLESSRTVNICFAYGCHPSTSDSAHGSGSTGKNGVLTNLERICAMISSNPLKRPTGKVVAIIEKSTRRDAVVAFLNVKQLFHHSPRLKKIGKWNKGRSLSLDHEHIQLTPTDSRLPKMMVLGKDLPESIKERVEDEDATLGMELVAARIDKWEVGSLVPFAQVSHVFGRGSEMEPHVNAILYENAVRCCDFSLESLSCLPQKCWEVPLAELQSRKDLRNMCLFTIDPSTATDLDDALSIESLRNGNVRVGVHIADASYFVLPGTALDIEAQIRSTSVYMLHHKIPMLPPMLSENLGSLNPGVDRLAFSMFWDFDSVGDIVDRWIGRTVIHSCCKLSYEHAQNIVDGVINEEGYSFLKDGLPQVHGHFQWPDVIKSIKSLHEISKLLREKRFENGALQLENAKISFLCDDKGMPYDSILCDWTESNFLVEEFMLLANRTAAEVISRTFPNSALLRRHPEPNMRKLRQLEVFCSKHGLEFDASSPGSFHCSLERIRRKLKNDYVLFNILISYATKPLQLATYFCSGDLKDNTNDWGHYALAVPLYTHFTSPLRRYPDILVHRTLAAAIEAEKLYLKRIHPSHLERQGKEITRIFTGICFDKDAAESSEGREALSAAALKHNVPMTEVLSDVAAYCNERKLARRHVKDACDKLYMWVLLKAKKVLLSEATVLGLGPRFMSIYVHKFSIECRINYEDIEGLTVEWLEATSTLVLSLNSYKRRLMRGLNEVAHIVNPFELKVDLGVADENGNNCGAAQSGNTSIATSGSDCDSRSEIEPLVFPLTVSLLSTIPVALHAIGGDDGPLDIGARLFVSSYFR